MAISHEHLDFFFLASQTLRKIVNSLDFSMYSTYMASYLRARLVSDFFAFPVRTRYIFVDLIFSYKAKVS